MSLPILVSYTHATCFSGGGVCLRWNFKMPFIIIIIIIIITPLSLMVNHKSIPVNPESYFSFLLRSDTVFPLCLEKATKPTCRKSAASQSVSVRRRRQRDGRTRARLLVSSRSHFPLHPAIYTSAAHFCLFGTDSPRLRWLYVSLTQRVTTFRGATWLLPYLCFYSPLVILHSYSPLATAGTPCSHVPCVLACPREYLLRSREFSLL